MVHNEGLPVKVLVVLLVVAVLFSALSIAVSLNVYQSFKSDFVPVRSSLPSEVAGSPSGEVGLTIISAPGSSP